jgi:DNA-directed RNA polymerase specialized sigma24 family protein
VEEPKQKTYEECYDIIDTVVSKYQNKWRLDAINWFDFEDVAQVVKAHIFKKWHMWDQSRPLEPWVSRVASHQIKNVIRNNYTNYVKPCMSCPHNLGDTLCSLTKSGVQNSSCALYAKWTKSKRQGYGIKMPLSIESHTQELNSFVDSSIDFDKSIENLNVILEQQLSPEHYRVYIMLFFENCSEEDVARYMGYKTSEKHRAAGYKQIKNIKKMLKEKVEGIISQNDIIL